MADAFTTGVASLHDVRHRAERGVLYAVLDACDEPRVPVKVRELGPERAVSLYRGQAESDLASIAPYLVHVSPDVLTWLGETCWTEPWGIFAVHKGDLDSLRTHLRKFLLVNGPNGDSWYFRFYDPRVLSQFLPTCDDEQLTELFGPLDAYGWVDVATYGVTLATRGASKSPGDAPQPPHIVFRRS